MDDTDFTPPDAELSYENLNHGMVSWMRGAMRKSLDACTTGHVEKRARSDRWYDTRGALLAGIVRDDPRLASPGYALRVRLYGERAREMKAQLADQFARFAEERPEQLALYASAR